MALNIQLLQGLVKEYGAPLYPQQPDVDAGTISADEYTLIDGNTLQIAGENGTVMYIPIRRATVEAGIKDGQVFNVGIFKALRDADGTTEDGKAWSVKAGDSKVFAF